MLTAPKTEGLGCFIVLLSITQVSASRAHVFLFQSVSEPLHFDGSTPGFWLKSRTVKAPGFKAATRHDRFPRSPHLAPEGLEGRNMMPEPVSGVRHQLETSKLEGCQPAQAFFPQRAQRFIARLGTKQKIRAEDCCRALLHGQVT